MAHVIEVSAQLGRKHSWDTKFRVKKFFFFFAVNWLQQVMVAMTTTTRAAKKKYDTVKQIQK